MPHQIQVLNPFDIVQVPLHFLFSIILHGSLFSRFPLPLKDWGDAILFL